MSLVKFTELPSGSIQGGDVLAVAGASSYKVTAVEYANWANKRIQGNTDKTIEEVWNRAKGNSDYTTNVINPQLGQIGTNKTDIAVLSGEMVIGSAKLVELDGKVDAELLRQYDNERSIIANMIMTNNYVKNPAAHHIKLYYKEQALRETNSIINTRLATENLEYPGWSRSGQLLTYNFNVACKGAFTLGVLGGTGMYEYQIDGGGWQSSTGIQTINIDNVTGVDISIRVNISFGGIAFGIIGAAYWLSKLGVKDGGIALGLTDLTYNIKRARIDLVACGYWFGWTSSEHSPTVWLKPGGMGYLTRWRTFETTNTDDAIERYSNWSDDTRNIMRLPDSGRTSDWMFASTDPDLFTTTEVF